MTLEQGFDHNSERPEYTDNDHLPEWPQEWIVPRFRLLLEIERSW
jgi:hypothetical protein